MTGTPKRTRRRWIWPVVAALGLSAVVQVGIVVMPDGWYTALHGGPATAAPRQFVVDENDNDVVWTVDHIDLGLFGEVISALTSNEISLRGEAESQDIAVLREPIVPGWSMFAGSSGAETMATTIESLDAVLGICTITELAEGWPWRCVRGETRTVRTWWEHTNETQMTVARTGQVHVSGNRWLPYLPIWPGLLLNLVVLALPWYAAYWIHGPGRRKYRRYRGCCTACGYDLAGLDGGTACPECGAVPRGGEPAAAGG